jgi:hypothetical protein
VSWKLAKTFGGITAYSRAPAEGRWATSGKVQHDDVVVVEVMVAKLDKAWWGNFRKDLEANFRQTEVIVRTHAIELL